MSQTSSAGTPWSWRLSLIFGIVALTIVAYVSRDTLGPRGQAAVGVFSFLAAALACSTNIRAINRRTVIAGFLLQVFLALMILQVEPVRKAFEWMGAIAKQFLSFSSKGGEFVFGPLVNVPAVQKGLGVESGVIFAFIVLPTVVFVSSVFTVLYHLGILQVVVRGFARVMRWVMGTSGAETLSVTANVFLGQTEAPLIVKPFIARMTRSELLALMIGGMAHISGALMAVYIGMGASAVAILATSVMAAPASLYIAKILVPETGVPETLGDVKPSGEKEHANVIDAAAAGASQGMQLAINIAAMLIAFIAFIAMFNFILGKIGPWFDMPQLSLEWIFSKLFSPIAFLTGVTADDCPRFGELLGKKLVLNEFVAFKDLADNNVIMKDSEFVGVKGIELRTYKLACFALTGFANFASIGIQLGGIGAMAPNRRSDLARLGLRALLGGFLATLINASIAGILMSD
ncbi:MAG TPA: nucleoside transporter C-terminal domain-containing protein [Gemmataceae bacterium]|jgi:CNT family concentrative nucleoside transporter|nr:nucleoside transporter C-terminal domain-containing protein [Gemmataceae bacterium]